MKTEKIKYSPQRMCIVCREKELKTNLFRLVFNNFLQFDDKQKKNGRGCYICKSAKCIGKSADGRLIRRAFRLRAISNLEIAQLIKKLEDNIK